MFDSKTSFDIKNTKKHTTAPTTIGSSVIGVRYNKGVVIAADNKISMHGYKKYTDITRIAPINKNTFMGSSGEYSDFQEVNRILVEKAEEDQLFDGFNTFIGPKEIANYLSHLCYHKRCKMNPYWNTTLIGGIDESNKPFLNSIDQFGTKYDNCYLVSGFALYFGGPILESGVPKDHTLLTKEKAVELIDHIFRVLFYRDATAGDTIYYGFMEVNELDSTSPFFELSQKKLTTNWEHDLFKKSHNERYHPIA